MRDAYPYKPLVPHNKRGHMHTAGSYQRVPAERAYLIIGEKAACKPDLVLHREVVAQEHLRERSPATREEPKRSP